ncbi:MAG: xanthine dehydrogenase family protein subunit M [SAR324 cluster bacterium]|jgi:carbon-monoxide dehydrogenase medium subunit|nr:carbon monoxide dehydrogenase [Deltaproteobacteria bacterium]MDP6091798.1 xanthine dehydrogenase family protein subunit M [SAR324 cluster bacterium]MDP6246428.1 xanthine dehydrogenase family protein subunit M [SAR324 cluster bacterium]MDP6463572.1 xanthine dehydrogenase family protein subunit M [SAR324 cluster bacterium]MDP7139878.1 xanthine dehydrogenase family protein subunit M [SAR324 cluster bacterium]|tara:strand:- start:3113 stop:3988 length:876 start_codon:yes stop_codon:yes gene_type:complete
MIPPSFEYLTPSKISDAIAMLQKHGEEAKILAGGHSLIPAMRLRLSEPGYLIDISGIQGLDYILEESGQLRIGAMTREASLEESQIVREKYPLLLDTAKMIADPSVRNVATVGGNLAHGDPANDHPATMLALGANVVVEGPNGSREIGIDDFFPDFFTTALEPEEILTEIRIPSPPSGSGGAYLKIERKVGDYAAAAVACQLNIDSGGSIQKIGIGLTNVGSTPIRASSAEQLLQGKNPDENMIAEAGRLSAADSEPMEDLRGSAEYKRALVNELTQRAIKLSLQRAEGSR